jgi:hypothetical protein
MDGWICSFSDNLFQLQNWHGDTAFDIWHGKRADRLFECKSFDETLDEDGDERAGYIPYIERTESRIP